MEMLQTADFLSSRKPTHGFITQRQPLALLLCWALASIFKPSKLALRKQTSLLDLSQAFVAKPTPRGRLFYVPIRVLKIKINQHLGTP